MSVISSTQREAISSLDQLTLEFGRVFHWVNRRDFPWFSQDAIPQDLLDKISAISTEIVPYFLNLHAILQQKASLQAYSNRLRNITPQFVSALGKTLFTAALIGTMILCFQTSSGLMGLGVLSLYICLQTVPGSFYQEANSQISTMELEFNENYSTPWYLDARNQSLKKIILGMLGGSLLLPLYATLRNKILLENAIQNILTTSEKDKFNCPKVLSSYIDIEKIYFFFMEHKEEISQLVKSLQEEIAKEMNPDLKGDPSGKAAVSHEKLKFLDEIEVFSDIDPSLAFNPATDPTTKGLHPKIKVLNDLLSIKAFFEIQSTFIPLAYYNGCRYKSRSMNLSK